MFRSLTDFLDKSTDKESVFHRVMRQDNAVREVVESDLRAFMIAGFDTTSHALMRVMYQLWRRPDCKQ
jgi:cytochrome P450